MNQFSFHLDATDWFARTGTITTPHGIIKTPIFMPVGTRSAVKWATIDQVKEIGSEIMLVNNYHSYLRPGCDVVESFGGLHNFMDVDIPILTDSGGFQVFSLGLGMQNEWGEKLAKVTEEWVHFRSYLDGSKHFFAPENVMDMQCALGADIMMAFDECAPGGSTYEYARQAMERTHDGQYDQKNSGKKMKQKRKEKWLHPQALFGIIQWVVYDDLRERIMWIYQVTRSSRNCHWLDSPSERAKEDMYRILDVLAPILPENKPHYLMGVGTPEDLVEWIARGIDMMDCVLPTRIGRHGEAFSSYGNIKIGGEKYTFSQEKIPMLPWFETQVSKKYSLGYLRHLINVGETTGGLLLSLHNLEYLLLLAKKSREAVIAGKFEEFRKEFWSVYPKG